MATISTGRRRAYRHRHKKPMNGWAKYVIGVTVAALLIFVFAVALGSKLGEIADNTDVTTVPSTTAPTTAPKMPVILAKAHSLAAPSDDTTEAPETTLPPDDTTANDETTAPSEPAISYNAISVLLRSFAEDGAALLHYSSPLTLKYSLASDSALDLEKALSVFAEDDYVSGVFALSFPSASSTEKNLSREYELALLCEIASHGIDEIVLLGFSSTPDGLAEANAFILELLSREDAASLAVGIALDHELLESEDAKTVLRESGISKAFLALDLYSIHVPELMSAEDFIQNKIDKCADTLSTYNLRLLLGCGKSPDLESQVRLALKNNIYNIQEVGK